MKLLCLALVAATALAGKITCTVSNDKNPHCKGSCNLSTDTPVKGQNFTVYATGVCDVDIQAASYHVDGKIRR